MTKEIADWNAPVLTKALHLLRNPYGHSDDDARWARNWAADKIEYLVRHAPLCPTCACLRGHFPCEAGGGTAYNCGDGFHVQR